jgi:methionyl-tRNA formyltransferase
VRLYLLTVEDPLYTHLVLEPLLASGAAEIAGVTILSPQVTAARIASSLVTLGPLRVGRAALAQFSPRILPTSVAGVLARHGIEADAVVRTTDVNEPWHIDRLRSAGASAMLVLNCPQIISTGILRLFERGVLNLHFGMLPRYRGIMPAYHALMAREPSFGVTVYLMDAKIDSGPILEQREVRIDAHDTLPTLYKKGFKVAAGLVVNAVRALAAGSSQPRPNDSSRASYYGQPDWQSLARYAALALKRTVALR